MKKTIYLLLVFTTTVSFSQEKLLASCCDATPAKSFGRCSGDASCTACTNCRYCKHCSKEGGSCGVCATYEAPKAKVSKKKAAKTAKAPSAYRRGQMLEVASETVNLRRGPGTDHYVVTELQEGEMLTFVTSVNEWIYVRVDQRGINGWVNYKFVK